MDNKNSQYQARSRQSVNQTHESATTSQHNKLDALRVRTDRDGVPDRKR